MKQKRFVSRVVSLIFLMSVLSMGNLFAQKAPKESPASDFKYELNETGDGVVIKGYLGKGGHIRIPSIIEDLPVVEFAATAFDGFSDAEIVSIVFPDSITTMQKSGKAFYFSSTIKKVVFPKNLKEIPNYLFESCKDLSEIILPEDLEIIGQGAFEDSAISSIVFPKKLKKIYDYAFRSCVNLVSITIPESIEYIGTGTFDGCSNLKTVNMPVKEIKYGNITGAFENCPRLTLKEQKKIKDTGYKESF